MYFLIYIETTIIRSSKQGKTQKRESKIFIFYIDDN